MGSEDHGSNDFRQAMGEEFSAAVSPPDAAPHECCEAIRQALGSDVTRARLADAFGAWFEVPPPAAARLRTAVDRTMAPAA